MYNKHLDAFLMAADCGSFTKAAEKLFISPNALIKQINLLEAKLELTLFSRTNHGIALTEAGKSIYRDARRIIQISEQAVATAHTLGRKTARDTARQLAHVSCPPHRQSMAGRQRGASAHQAANCANGRQQNNRPELRGNKDNDVDIIAGIFPSTLWKIVAMP